MVLLLLALLLVETLTGLYVANDIADVGPLTAIVPAPAANAIEAAHMRSSGTCWWRRSRLHVLAIASYAVIKGQDLVRPMITGTKALPEAVVAPRMASQRARLSYSPARRGRHQHRWRPL